MKNVKKFITLFSLVLIGFNSFAKDNSQKQIKIGFSMDTLIVERWVRDLDIFKSTAKKFGAEVIVENAANDTKLQINQIEKLIKENVDVLVIVAKDCNAVSEVVKKAKKKHIPVISYDRLILNADVDLYLSIDSFAVGKIMSEELLKVCPKGKYFCIYGSDDDSNMKLVDKGVHSVLNSAEAKLDTVYFTPDWNYDLAYRQVLSLFEENNIPDAIICGNDAIAETVIRAVSEQQLEKKIYVVGQDADILACKHIISGTQTATVYKPINKLAQIAAESACQMVLQNYTFPKEVINNGVKDVPVVWLEPIGVTKENLDEVIIKSGFHSTEEVY